MLGIGAANAKDANGIAWKQNKDFEALLRRLNEGSGKADAAVLDGDLEEEAEGLSEVVDKGTVTAGERKRKKDRDDTDEKQLRKRRRKGESGEATSPHAIVEQTSVTATAPTKLAAPHSRAYVCILCSLLRAYNSNVYLSAPVTEPGS